MIYDLTNASQLEILDFFRNSICENKIDFKIKFEDSYIALHGYRALVELSQLFFMKITGITKENNFTVVEFHRLNKKLSFHNATSSGTEKYGTKSKFFNIDKSKEFTFLHYYIQALKFVDINNRKKILNLGINKADEFKIIKDILDADSFKNKKFVGIDYSKSIIKYAKKIMPFENITFLTHDINKLNELPLEKFDLLVSIGTLQSSNINFNKTFMDIYQNLLEKNGSVILGFPNCRWMENEMIYGAKAPNYSFNEMSLLLKDIHFCKKYLQQKGYRVVVTGKDYLFLSAKKII